MSKQTVADMNLQEAVTRHDEQIGALLHAQQEQGRQLARLTETLDRGFAEIHDRFSRSQRVNWSAVGVMLSFAAMLAALVWWPLSLEQAHAEEDRVKQNRVLQDMRADQLAILEKTTILWWENQKRAKPD